MNTIAGFNTRISECSLRVPVPIRVFLWCATHIQVYRGRRLITVARLVHRKSFISYYYIVIRVSFRLLSPSLIIYFLHSATETFHEVFFLQNKRKTRTKKKQKFTNIRSTDASSARMTTVDFVRSVPRSRPSAVSRQWREEKKT